MPQRFSSVSFSFKSPCVKQTRRFLKLPGFTLSTSFSNLTTTTPALFATLHNPERLLGTLLEKTIVSYHEIIWKSYRSISFFL